MRNLWLVSHECEGRTDRRADGQTDILANSAFRRRKLFELGLPRADYVDDSNPAGTALAVSSTNRHYGSSIGNFTAELAIDEAQTAQVKKAKEIIKQETHQEMR